MQSRVEQQVMAGVASIYLARKLLSCTALECYALFACSFSLTLLVSLPHVTNNFLHVEQGGLPAIRVYLLSAILNTSHLVQVLAALGALALILMLIDAARALTTPQTRLA